MITTIIILSVLNIFFMFAYACELRRRDKFKEFMENWINNLDSKLELYHDDHPPQWIETERDTLEYLLMEFNKWLRENS